MNEHTAKKFNKYSGLFSHPEKPLEEHLKNVAILSEHFLQEKPKIVQRELLPVIRIVGLTHDLGKATRSFQNYLLHREERTQRAQHSLFSAVSAFYLVKELKLQNELYPIFAYVTVRRHHGDLIDLKDEVSLIDEKEIDNLILQLDDIEDEPFMRLISNLVSYGLPVRIDKKMIRFWIENIGDEFRRYKRLLRHTSDIKNYVTLNLLYSILLDADKSDVVIGDEKAFKRFSVDGEMDWVRKYLSELNPPQTLLNNLRQKAFEEVNSAEIPEDKKIFSINLPTGFGKTLTGFSFALKLRNTLKNLPQKPRIIYSLPYLSIIDQNAKILEEILLRNETEPTSNVILKHHHLADVYYKTYEKKYKPDEAKILLEGWNSEIIVTTFVQLFHTLLSNKNSILRKFHKLANSIIILDEIQSIPVKYWKITEKIFTEVSKFLNSTIIIMTATDPVIFEESSPFPLVKSKEYYRKFNRIKMVPQIETPLTISRLYEETKSLIFSGKTVLYVFNTISSAREFYRLLSDAGVPRTFLSSHIIPKERLKRINEIKDGLYKVVVSTQLVEAGVDIDFDIVVRDIAPFDSLVQSAGRCNRNNEKQMGMVYVKKLCSEKGHLYATRIYDLVLINATEQLLKGRAELKEEEIYNLLDGYYKIVKERMNQEESRKILEAVLQLRYDSEDNMETAISDFRLIEEDYPKVDVFIELDDDAERVWKEYERIYERIDDTKNLWERRSEFLKIRKDFYNHVISIPATAKNMPAEVNGIRYVSKSQIEDYYDHETGYKADEETLMW